MIRNADQDQNGAIDFDEFLDLMANLMADTNHEEELVESFRSFDKDGNGLVGQADLEYVMLNMGVNVGKSEIQAMIESVDKD